MDLLHHVVLSRDPHRNPRRAHLRPLVGVRVPLQRLLQRMCGRDELPAQGHAAAAGLGAEHGGREELRVVLIG